MLSIKFSVSVSMHRCGEIILKDIQLKVFPSYFSDTSLMNIFEKIIHIHIATYALHVCMIYIYPYM